VINEKFVGPPFQGKVDTPMLVEWKKANPGREKQGMCFNFW